MLRSVRRSTIPRLFGWLPGAGEIHIAYTLVNVLVVGWVVLASTGGDRGAVAANEELEFQAVSFLESKTHGQNSAPLFEYQDDYRTWTDATGKFSVEAKIFELGESEVKLLKRDGRIVTLPFERFVEGDQSYLKEVLQKRAAEQSPFEDQSLGPGASTGVEDMSSDRSNGSEQPNSLLRLQLPFQGQNVQIANEIPFGQVEWSYVPGEQKKHDRDRSISLPKSKFDESEKVFTTSTPRFSGRAGELVTVLRNNSRSDFLEAIVVDVNKETIRSHFTLPVQSLRDFVVSPSGDRVVTIHDPVKDSDGGIVFWKINDGRLIPEKNWNFDKLAEADSRSNTSSSSNKFYADSSMFVDENRLFTAGKQLALWDIEADKCIYSVSDTGRPKFSRDFSHVAFFRNDSIWLMRIIDGALVGRIRCDQVDTSYSICLEFSPDNRRLVVIMGKAIYGFDLTNGAIDFSVDSSGPFREVQWADNSLLLVNGRSVVDPKLEVEVWRYESTNDPELTIIGSTTWFSSRSELLGIELINKVHRNEIVKNTAGLTKEDLIVYRPGTKLALVTNLALLNDQASPIAEKLKAKLEQQGFVIDNNAPLRLEASVTRGEPVEEEFETRERSAFGRVTERVRYTPHVSELKLTRDGEVIWNASERHRFSGIFLRLADGESPQDAVERLSRPDPNFFSQTTLPANLIRLPKGRPVGKSQLGSIGIQ
ncbi:MAG: SHD1 domain-containing protein [Pirellulaceae bacterium]|nr:SHD1 domain-containing protein [Pirellulaceae bacterium]